VRSTIGSCADATDGNEFVVLILLLVGIFFFFAFWRRQTPWYEQRRVVETRKGRLHEHAWDKQVPAHPDLHSPGEREER
jgi:hypothetical protein